MKTEHWLELCVVDKGNSKVAFYFSNANAVLRVQELEEHLIGSAN